MVWFATSMLDWRILGVAHASKGWTVRPLKRYMIWVQNVVRQFGLYLQQYLTKSEILIVRKDLRVSPSGVPVVLKKKILKHRRVATDFFLKAECI